MPGKEEGAGGRTGWESNPRRVALCPPTALCPLWPQNLGSVLEAPQEQPKPQPELGSSGWDLGDMVGRLPS